MRKLLFFTIFITPFLLFSCKEDKSSKAIDKTESTSEKDYKVTANAKGEFVRTGKYVYTLLPDSTHVNWTAYKTTDKIPVKGTFKSVNFENLHKGNNITQLVDGLKFSIPVSSLFSNNEIRDKKLKESFFGKMIETKEIHGEIVAKSFRNAYANITMNGITTKLPVLYSNNGDAITMTATMDLKNWKAEPAVAALNLVCKDLHKGADGISKTWDEVAIEIKGRLSIDK